MLILNPNADPSNEYGSALQAILNHEGFEAARREITGWPGYAPTPMVALPGLAAHAGLGAIFYKDEG
ncbi:MAG: diaminopropionate ammonia-lyase, partial [Alphaproteobacteria bacterium]